MPTQPSVTSRPLCWMLQGPFTGQLEQQAGQLMAESAADAATQALHFLGNTHAHISTKQRKRIINHFNADLRPLVKDVDRFQSATPLLFGKNFEESAKEHVESVWSLKHWALPTADTVSRTFFSQAAPTPIPKLLMGAARS